MTFLLMRRLAILFVEMNAPSGAGTVWPSKGKDGANSESLSHQHGYIGLFFGAGNSWRRNYRNKFVLFYGESYEKVGRSDPALGKRNSPLGMQARDGGVRKEIKTAVVEDEWVAAIHGEMDRIGQAPPSA